MFGLAGFMAGPKIKRPKRKLVALLVLPTFELLKRQPRPPHVARTLITRLIPNKFGTLIRYELRESRKGNAWWISASLDGGMRMSNTLHTTVPAKAAHWYEAIESSSICIDE